MTPKTNIPLHRTPEGRFQTALAALDLALRDLDPDVTPRASAIARLAGVLEHHELYVSCVRPRDPVHPPTRSPRPQARELADAITCPTCAARLRAIGSI